MGCHQHSPLGNKGLCGQVFAHNDVDSLEAVLRRAIAEGQPRTRRPWRKIVVVVEGIYSMEGEAAALAAIVAVKKKYKVGAPHQLGAHQQPYASSTGRASPERGTIGTTMIAVGNVR